MAKATECTPCTSDLRSYEIDYDEVSECSESFADSSHHKKGRTAKGNEISPAKMPLMRIRSVEIVFEDEMSACTDTALLDKSIELIVSDSSDDSTKCLDDLEHLLAEKEDNDDSVTLNAEADLSDDNSVSLSKDNAIIDDDPIVDTPQSSARDADDTSQNQCESLTLPNEDVTLSLNVSEIGDSGRFTEDASTSHFEAPILTYEDAMLSHSFDAINVDKASNTLSTCEISDVCSFTETSKSKLYEYIDSDSDSSDNTAVCDVEISQAQHLTPLHNTITSDDDHTVCDSSDLQYDSFVDMGKF